MEQVKNQEFLGAMAVFFQKGKKKMKKMQKDV